MKDKKQLGFSFHVTKENAKPNAPKYKIKTISELYKVVNSENVDRFLKDFSSGIKIAVHMRDAMNIIGNVQTGKNDNQVEKGIDLDSFTWIDD